MKRVAIFVAPGKSEDAEVVVPADVFVRAGYEVTLISLGKAGVTQLGRRVSIVTDIALLDEALDLRSFDVLSIAGGDVLDAFREQGDKVKCAYQNPGAGQILAAICAAPVLLGEWGVLSGKQFTCYPGMQEQVGSGIYVPAPAVQDGNVVTGAGPGASFEYALQVVTALDSEVTSAKLRESLVVLGA